MLLDPVIEWVARQVQAAPDSWAKYGERDVTRREHAQGLPTYLGLLPFGLQDYRALVRELTDLAQQTDSRSEAGHFTVGFFCPKGTSILTGIFGSCRSAP